MSNRTEALGAAVLLYQKSPVDPATVIGAAAQFEQFLDGAPATPEQGKKPAKSAAKPASKAPEQTDPGPTTEQVGARIAALIAANKKVECAAELAKLGAKSKSSLAPENYAAFMEATTGLLPEDGDLAA
jgi:hypothetical protein